MTTNVITEAVSYARAFRIAADLIDAEGYDRHAENKTLLGYSVIGALDVAADHVDLFSDSLWSAFCGWLVLRGLVSGSDDAGIARWETDSLRRPAQHDVTAELRAAADSFGPARRKLADHEIRTVRDARDLAGASSADAVRGWLAANGSPAAGENYTVETAAALNHAQSLIKSLAALIDDLTA